MIPVLFDSNEKVYTSNGLGRLTDCISCLVTEERNGIYECEFTYPITGVHYDKIQEGNIIVVSHDEQKDRQPFIIYRISRPISGIVTINCHHISYKLSNVIVSPFSAVSVTDAFNSIVTNSMTDNPFTFWTDKASAGSIDVSVPTACKSILGGTQGSILDSFGGGEYEWDGYTVKLYANRGSDNGVTIRYGKNLTNVVAERDVLGLYNAVIPYWSDGENTVVYGGIVIGGGIAQSGTWTDENNLHITDENNTDIEFRYVVQKVTTMDLSGEFEDQPTVQELETRAATILSSNQPWVPKDNIKIDFIALWQTEEYANIAPLERVQLCDTVSVYYPELGVDVKAKVVKVVWDSLLERYDSVELGEVQTSFADVIKAETNEMLEDVPNISMMDAAIQHATKLITGGLGGHIVFLYDANGLPTDMLVMDTEDVSTAVNVLRINVNGIGFSSSGVSGPFTSAWTLDGSFVADFITAGHISCNRIQGGELTLGGANNGNGVLVVYDASGTEIGRYGKDGLYQKSGNIISNLGTAIYRDRTSNGIVQSTGTGFSVRYDTNDSDNIPPDASFYVSPGSTNLEIRKDSSATVNETTLIAQYPFVNSGSTVTPFFEKEITEDVSEYKEEYVWRESNKSITYWQKIFNKNGFKIRKSTTVDTVAGLYLTSGNGIVIRNGAEINLPSGTQSGAQIAFTSSSATFSMPDSGAVAFFDIAKGGRLVINSNGAVSLYEGGSYSSNRLYMYRDTTFQFCGKNVQLASSSSKKYKHDIAYEISNELDAHRLYELKMVQFIYNEDYRPQYLDMKDETIPGFIAEDVAEVYPSAVIHDEGGNIESWDERRIIPGMLKLIQEQKEQIDMLEARLAKLEAMMGV